MVVFFFLEGGLVYLGLGFVDSGLVVVFLFFFFLVLFWFCWRLGVVGRCDCFCFFMVVVFRG